MRTGYAESSGSRDGEYHDGDSHKENLRRSDGILRTVDVSMEWTLSREQKEAQRDDRFVPLPLREPYKQT